MPPNTGAAASALLHEFNDLLRQVYETPDAVPFAREGGVRALEICKRHFPSMAAFMAADRESHRRYLVAADYLTSTLRSENFAIQAGNGLFLTWAVAAIGRNHDLELEFFNALQLLLSDPWFSRTAGDTSIRDSGSLKED